MYVCLYVCVCMYVCMYVCVYVMYICMYVCMSVMYICMYVRTYVCVCMCVRVCMYVLCTCVDMYVYTYIKFLPDSQLPTVFFAILLWDMTHSVTHKMDVENISLSCNQRSLNSRSRPNVLGIPNMAKCHLCGIMATNNRQKAQLQTLSC